MAKKPRGWEPLKIHLPRATRLAIKAAADARNMTIGEIIMERLQDVVFIDRTKAQ